MPTFVQPRCKLMHFVEFSSCQDSSIPDVLYFITVLNVRMMVSLILRSSWWIRRGEVSYWLMLYTVIVNYQICLEADNDLLFLERKECCTSPRRKHGGQKKKQSIRSLYTFFLQIFCWIPRPRFLPPLISSFHTSCFQTLILSLFSQDFFFPSAVLVFFSPSVCVMDVAMTARGITKVTLY